MLFVYFYTDFGCQNGCGCQYCTPFIFVDEFAGTYTKKVDFWTSGHYSRSVQDAEGGIGYYIITAPDVIKCQILEEHEKVQYHFIKIFSL